MRYVGERVRREESGLKEGDERRRKRGGRKGK